MPQVDRAPGRVTEPDSASLTNGNGASEAEDAYFSELIASLPDEVEPSEERSASANRRPVTSLDDAWKPRHSLDDAIGRLSPEIRQTLESRLGGQFREVRRYRPSRSRELDSAGAQRSVEAPDESLSAGDEAPDED